MSFVVISGEYCDQNEFKTLQQGSEHTDAHHIQLNEYGDQDQFKTLNQRSEHTDTHHMYLIVSIRYNIYICS